MKKIAFILFVFFIGGLTKSFGQSKTDSSLPNFKVLIESNSKSVKLTGKEGCSWKELSFSATKDGKPTFIDQFGMVGKEKNNDARFSFSIQKTSKGFNLKGINGTAWSSLTVDCPKGNCKQLINQDGMIK
jgi:hypothetical protein